MRFFLLSIVLYLHATFLFADAVIVFEDSGKQGLKDEEGHILIPARFDQLGWSSGQTEVVGDLIGYKKDGSWGLISVHDKIITEPLYKSLIAAHNGLYVASRHDKSMRFVPSGVIDSHGKTVIPFLYLKISQAGPDHFIVQSYSTHGMRFGLVASHNSIILEPRFAGITYLGNERIGIKNDLGKWALFDMDGNPQSAFLFDGIDKFTSELSRAYISGSVGLLNKMGEWAIEPGYSKIEVHSQKALVNPFPQWDILTSKNEKLHSVAFDSVLPWKREYWKVVANGHEWIVDQEFNPVTPNTYNHIDWLNDQLMLFSEENRYGIIKPNGQIVLKPRYDTIFMSRGRIYAYQKRGVELGWSLYNLDGKRVSTFTYQAMHPEQESGLIPVKRNLKWGMLRRDGSEAIQCTYDSIGSSIPGKIVVGFKGQSGIIDEKGNWVLTPVEGQIKLINQEFYLLDKGDVTYLKHMQKGTVYFTSNSVEVKDGYFIETRSNQAFWKINFSGQILNASQRQEYQEIRLESEGFIAVKMGGRYGFIDKQDRLRIANRYDDVTDFHDGLAGFKLLNKWGFLDKQERIVVQPRFDEISGFVNGFCVVSVNGLKGVIDKMGNWVIKPEYERIELLENGRYKITKGGKTGLLDSDGRIIVNPKYDTVNDLADGEVIVRRMGKYGLVSRRGDDLIPIVYDILLFDPYNQCYLGMKKIGVKTIPLR